MPQETSPYFSISCEDGVSIVRLSRADVVDSVYIERAAADLQRYAGELTKPALVFDMTAVRQLSSAALGMLVGVHNTVKARGGQVSIAGLDPKLREVFKITKLNKVISICDDLPAAKRFASGQN